MRLFLRPERIEGHTFLALPAAGIVVDGGYSRGRFSAEVAKRYDARVIAFEPDATVGSEPSNERVELRRMAIGTGAPAVLRTRPGSDASIVLKGEGGTLVPTVRLDALLHELASVDLVKLDIEGAEIEAIVSAGPGALKRVDQLTVEFHDFIDSSLAPGVEAAKARLREAGFSEFRFSRDNTDVLFVNRARVRLPMVARFWLLIRYRYVRGAFRLLRRTVVR